MLAIAALAAQKKSRLLVLDWAVKEAKEAPPTAILIELGRKDQQPTAWSSRATVQGAKVVHREGYRFHEKDKLVEPNGWEASTFRQPQRANMAPVMRRLFATAPVGIVLHLADVERTASLTLQDPINPSRIAIVALQPILAGQTHLLWEGAVSIRRIAAATPVVTAKTEDDFPAAAYGPDGTLWVAYISYTLKDESRRTSKMQIPEQPADFKAYYTPEFGDQLFVKCYRNGRWSDPIAMTGPQEDLVRCALAVEGDGTVWAAYSANRQGNYDLYARPLQGKENPRPGPEQRLTKSLTPDLTPVMCTDQAGRPWLACQSWNDAGTARIALFQCRDGRWTEGPALPGHKEGANRWYPALAAGPDGQVAVAYDVYQDGDYDVHVAVIDGGKVTDHLIAGSPKFEARPAVVYDPQGRLWVAYEEGPERWGKDFGALEKVNQGHPLYDARTVRAACLVDGKLLKPAAELPAPQGPPRQTGERTGIFAYPRLGIDGQGRLWLGYRQKLFTPFGVQPGTNWITVVRHLDGDKWSEPVDLHHSDGLLDSRPVFLPHASGGLLTVQNTDGRYTTPTTIDNQIYASVVSLDTEDLAVGVAAPKLVPAEPGTKDNKTEAEERAAVRRVRQYTVDAQGKKLRLVRGEFHRHTEISGDGGGDGSLEDMWRYAIDVAALDWIGNTDHDNGGGREYTWWLTQKYSDAYHVANTFTPMFSYERSVQYPMGHRNCVFARRGVRTLPRLAEPDQAKRVGGVHADDTKMLYRYLKELDGICASHTSATNMGTDWRDNDPLLEPLVEIYQGDRNNYEYEDAPRSGHDPQGNKLPASIGGWQPKGFVINALKDKGYRLGFQSSSDHISTHISYCVVLAERLDRAAILAALKKRRAYAATDDIVLDVRSGTHLMGDQFKTQAVPSLRITAVGVKPLAAVHILRDSQVVETFKPDKPEFQGTWTDPKPVPGTHFYYVRVEQADEELAWSSPMWIDYAK
jgi:hypothetical protein